MEEIGITVCPKKISKNQHNFFVFCFTLSKNQKRINLQQ